VKDYSLRDGKNKIISRETVNGTPFGTSVPLLIGKLAIKKVGRSKGDAVIRFPGSSVND